MTDKKYSFNPKVNSVLYRNGNTRLVRSASGALHYHYTVPGGGAFRYSQLCEVGEPWIPEFSGAIRGILKQGFVLISRELSVAPWIQDYLIEGKLAEWQLKPRETEGTDGETAE